MKMNEIMSRTTNADQIGSMKALLESIEELDDEKGVYVEVKRAEIEPDYKPEHPSKTENRRDGMISCWITVPTGLKAEYNVESVKNLLQRHELDFAHFNNSNPHIDMERYGMMRGAVDKEKLMKLESSLATHPDGSKSDTRFYFIPDNGET